MSNQNEYLKELCENERKRKQNLQRIFSKYIDFEPYDIKGNPQSPKMLFLYETGPLDHWEGWDILLYKPNEIFKNHMSCRQADYEQTNPHEEIYEIERLMIRGLINFSKYFINDVRGEALRYCEVREEANENGFGADTKPAICLKCDNNGTCYAFSYSPLLASNLPHDFGDDWTLIDACEYIR